MTSPVFGIEIQKIGEEARPAIVADMSILGLVGVAPDADDIEFPVDTPVFRYSNDPNLLAHLGEAGNLYHSLQAINGQLGEFQVAAKVIIVRVEVGGDDDETMTNLIGDNITKTGVNAFRRAGALLGHVPRLLLAPGYTVETKTGVVSLVLTNVGDNYTSQPDVALNGGGGTGATAKAILKRTTLASVTVDDGGTDYTAPTVVATGGGSHPQKVLPTLSATVDQDGIITAINVVTAGAYITEDLIITITEDGHGGDLAAATAVLTSTTLQKLEITAPGTGYATNPTVAFSGGGGTGAAGQATIGPAANALLVEMTAVATSLLAHIIADAPHSSDLANTNWREAHSSDRIIPVAMEVKVGQAAETRPGSPYAAGLIVRTDFEHGGVPSHTAANRAIQGIVAPERYMDFSITDGATEGQDYLSRNMGIIVRGEVGVESAIARAGFIYIGTDTLSEDVLWTFYNVNRMRDYIHLIFLQTLRFYLGRYNITYQTIDAIRQTMVNALEGLKAFQHILGYKVDFRGEHNSADELRLGHVKIQFAAEEPPVLRKLTIRSLRYRPALDDLVANIVQQLETAQ